MPSARSPIVDASFAVPDGLATDHFVLEPLGPERNESDLAAWSNSVDHIHSTPGFEGHSWPDEPMTLERNRGDLEAHAADFEARTGFTWTVLEPGTGEVIGCVYMYPAKSPGHDVDVRSWVRADRAHLDGPLHDAVVGWMADAWPWTSPAYAARPTTPG